MKWFEWTQNNSGGGFDVDKEVCHRLFIQAESYEEAEEKALDMGVYYDGCHEGYDCPCCGDRWYEGDEVNPPDELRDRCGNMVKINGVEGYAQYLADQYGWTEPDARLFYSDGQVVEIKTKEKK